MSRIQLSFIAAVAAFVIAGAAFYLGRTTAGRGEPRAVAPALARQRLVIGKGLNEATHPVAKALAHLISAGRSVFEHVVQDSRDQHLHILDLRHIGDQHRDLDQVVHVRSRIRPLTPLGAVPLRCKIEFLQKARKGHLRPGYIRTLQRVGEARPNSIRTRGRRVPPPPGRSQDRKTVTRTLRRGSENMAASANPPRNLAVPAAPALAVPVQSVRNRNS